MNRLNQEFEELQRQLSQIAPPRGRSSPAIPPATCRMICPQCRQQIEVQERHVGRYIGTKIECSLCRHVFRASLKRERRMRAELQRRQALEAQAEQSEKDLTELQEKQERRLLDLAAHGALTMDEEPAGESAPAAPIRIVAHTWPFDHHVHPPGLPIKRYVLLWVYALLAAAVCWCLFLSFASNTVSEGAVTEQAAQAVASPAHRTLLLFLLAWGMTGICALMFSGLVGAIVSHGKGRPHKEGFLFAVFLGPLGWILAGLMPNHSTHQLDTNNTVPHSADSNQRAPH